ncbi:unnamed protein product [Ambrosiozyma monospora]|uniref:Unnamed protein product n=1 Tax=Ambrosiozyma monospora TaxID=43982 RepID=A0A9W6YVE6_AMBMO|nr:unnamed protein product [Ambrosiozyma monospora]
MSEHGDSNILEEEKTPLKSESHDTFSSEVEKHEVHRNTSQAQTTLAQPTSVSNQDATDQLSNDKYPTREELNNVLGMMREFLHRYDSMFTNSSGSAPSVTSTVTNSSNAIATPKPTALIDSNHTPISTTSSSPVISRSQAPEQGYMSSYITESNPSEGITEQDKYNATFWAKGIISVLKRDVEASKSDLKNYFIFEADKPDLTVEMLFSNWWNIVRSKPSNAYHTVNLLLSEEPALWNLHNFECAQFEHSENKSSLKLYALELLSKEVYHFMLNVLNYRAGMEFPDSDSERDSYLGKPSALARMITGFQKEPGEPAILREYLDAMLTPISIDICEALEKIILTDKRIKALDDMAKRK